MQKRILRERECAAATGLPTSTRYDLIKLGLFPKPIKLGPKASGWLAEEIDAWLQERIAARDTAA